ncbi:MULTISPECIES: hypothetical protein [Metallosphaera]|uniref:Uncharacterized protein n=3 Tax=Metallosphaera TaxID=41980 RepID=A4YE97_METS5|nr:MULTISPECIES: hypothetical protein [Metallosphaera]ABP94749.1 hypothetical protein Msed_0574 [Metallosphaera sedula DSM 5348]AIM26736.1 hypothetical protein HA72_0574 [Metallosphaera sedula]AKV73692.1 hypothetical protein MsedA_0586 [Metallosphaera sedula]AKV75932.1 hypothetical protein MsedB_0586 [Metallosphaera sedula]AKV78183.1 hypothetical protein MsedC_0585 [Metallosphaera sedula]
MELIETQEVFDRVSQLINSATERLIVLTDRIRDSIAQDLLRKAGSGVDVKLITSDLNWARWLENRAKGYMKDEEEKISQEVQELSNKIEFFNRVPWIALVVVGAVWIVLLVRGLRGLEMIPALLVGLGVIYYIMYYSYKRRRSYREEIAVKAENRERIAEEYKGVRESLSKHLHVIEIDFELSFSVIISDTSAIITSTPLETEKERGYHVFTELEVEEAMKIVDSITSIQSLKRP